MSKEKEAVNETQQFYNSTHFDVPKSYKSAQHKRFLKLGLELPEEGKVIDVGAGAGRSARAISKMNPKLDVTVLDIAEKSLARLSEFKQIHASALEVPLPDESFDVVISVGCLHHTPNARKGFNECTRILKPGGKIVIALYNKWTIYPLLYNIGKRFPNFIKKRIKIPIIQDQYFTPHASFHSPTEVQQWFKENDIEFIKMLGTGYVTPFFPNKYCQFMYYYGKKAIVEDKK